MILLAICVQVLGLFSPERAVVRSSGAGAQAQEVRADGNRVLAPGRRPELRIAGPRVTVALAQFGTRTYAGSLRIRARAGRLVLLNEVPLEDYVASVVGAELADGPPAAQEALAVVVPSYALARGGETCNASVAAPPAHIGLSPLCDSTRCQLYQGTQSAARGSARAARATAGLVLLTGTRAIAPALHFESCGGATVDAEAIWPCARSRAPCVARPAALWWLGCDGRQGDRMLAIGPIALPPSRSRCTPRRARPPAISCSTW